MKSLTLTELSLGPGPGRVKGGSPCLAALVAVLGALPILITRPTPLQDWPNHVARAHIVSGLLRHDPFWMGFYRLTGFLVPNAVLDLGLIGLARLGLSPQAAGQAFVLVTYLVFVGGFCALARALDASGPVKPMLAVLLFYDNALFWGLVSYMLGIGLMLGLLATWLSCARPWQRLVVAGAGAAVLVFTHAVAGAAWAVVLAGFDLCRLRSSTGPAGARVFDAASSVVAVATVALLLFLTSAGGDGAIVYAGRGPAGVVAHKLLVFAETLLGGGVAQDASSLLALLVCVGVCLGGSRIGVPSAVAVGLLVLVTLAAPERLGGGSLLDARLAVLPLVLLAASVRVRPGWPGLWAVFAAVGLRTLVLAACWLHAGAVFAEFRRHATVPAGSVMMMAYGTRLSTLSWQTVWSPPITSIGTQLVFRDVFVPSIFANPKEQPIALLASYRTLNQPWNLVDAAHVSAALPRLRALCASHRFAGVFLTALYPGGLAADHVGLGLIYAGREFVILDACRGGVA